MRSRWVRRASLVLVPVVLLVGLRLGWLNWLVADGGPVRKTLEGLSWVAAVVAVGFSVFELRRQKPEVSQSVYVGRALHLDGDRLPRVADVSLLALRVKRAVGTSDGQALPRYVPRDRDDDLEWAIASGGLVLLHGRAAAGKSRAAAEAIRRLRPSHDLLVPVDGPALRRIAESGLTDTVVWLDDLERFLVPGGLDVGLLQRLVPSACVVATIRDNELAAYRTSESAISAAAADVIASIPPSHLIAIDQRLTEAEQERAREAQAADPRIGRALAASEGFAEYLAAGTPMLERWSTGDSPLFYVGQALISAAVDCRRAGYAEAVPGGTLAGLHRGYLPTPWCDRPDLPPVAEGLAWAARPVLGASSCLQPRSDGTYLASDYLVDRAQEGTSPLGDSPIPDRTWEALFVLSSDQSVVALGSGAYRAGRYEVAERCFRRAFQAGDTFAQGLLGVTLGKLGRTSEIKEMFRDAARSQDEVAMRRVAVSLSFNNRFEDLLDLAKEAVRAGDEAALLFLTACLDDSGDLEHFHDLSTVAVDHGQSRVIIVVLTMTAKHLPDNRLVDLAVRAIENGQNDALMGILLTTDPGSAHIATLLTHITRNEVEDGVATVMAWLARRNRFRDIADVARNPSTLHRDQVVPAVAAMLSFEEELTELLTLTREAVDAEHVDDLRTFAAALTHVGKQAAISDLRQYAIDRGCAGSAELLATFVDQDHEH